jgi:endonuclease/exonuclease/phosphatase family metal-dependent hydrolase
LGNAVLSAPAACTFTVASYNVHRCIGADGRHDPGRVARVVHELDADVVGLQEVATRRGGHGVDQLAFLAHASGYHAVAGPVVVAGESECGNGLLTKRPILSVERLDLSIAGREPRGALDVRLAVGDEVVRVIVTHLGLRWRDRRAQVRRLLAALGDDAASFVVLLGDINEWVPRIGCLGRLDRRLGASRGVRSFPARRPLVALDRIWVQPHAGLESVVAHATPLARVASDHLPVRGAIAWAVDSPAVSA